ncbi:MAG: hypothetical protein HKN03_04275 [Acidimicrobiales bacterium]|nr:hypothetical protein [Acidimicrobiales bacterium]
MNFAVAFLIVLANVLGAGMILPQVLRVHQTRSTAGVSLSGTGVGIVMNLWWVVYGLEAGVPGMIPVSVAGSLLYATIAFQSLRLLGLDAARSIAKGILSYGVVPLGPYLLTDIRTLGLVIGLMYTVQFAPAAVAAVSTSDPTGISLLTWTMALLEAVIWLAYGIITRDIALTVGGVGGSAMASLIILQLTSHRGRSRRLVPLV